MMCQGLLNLAGSNHCWLNVVVQALWHLSAFRKEFVQNDVHEHVGNDCIFCALQTLFAQFEHGEDQMLPPDILRHALARNFMAESRFQLKEMDDAAEAFLALLSYLHMTYTGGREVCEPRCYVHKCFSMNLVDMWECSCGATGEPQVSSNMNFHAYVAEIVSESRQGTIFSKRKYDDILAAIQDKDGNFKCAESWCERDVKRRRVIEWFPAVFVQSLVWPSNQASVEEVLNVLDIIELNIDLRKLFYTSSSASSQISVYKLRGFINYYGKHYMAYFFSDKANAWIRFDDTNVRALANWDEVKATCSAESSMPCLLFYENAEFIAKSTNLALTNLVPATPVVITKEFLFSLKDIEGSYSFQRQIQLSNNQQWKFAIEKNPRNSSSLQARLTRPHPRDGGNEIDILVGVDLELKAYPVSLRTSSAPVRLDPGQSWVDTGFLCEDRQKMIGVQKCVLLLQVTIQPE